MEILSNLRIPILRALEKQDGHGFSDLWNVNLIIFG